MEQCTLGEVGSAFTTQAGHQWRGRNNRLFVKAVLWLVRNGARWQALPAKWKQQAHTTYTRFQR